MHQEFHAITHFVHNQIKMYCKYEFYNNYIAMNESFAINYLRIRSITQVRNGTAADFISTSSYIGPKRVNVEYNTMHNNNTMNR